MTNDDTLRYPFEYPDQAGYPDGTGFLSEDQKVLIDEVVDDHELGIPFELVHNATESTYEAITGSTELGNLRYEIIDEDRISLLTTMVWPEFRGQGVATELIRRVLDDLKNSGRHVTIMCPIVRTFIDRNPGYESLVDPRHQGDPTAGPVKPSRYAFEYPAEAGYPDGTGALSHDQAALIDEVIDDPHSVASDFTLVNDGKNRIYEAVLDDRTIAGLTYNVAGDDRLVLLAVAVFPEFRKQGIASELIRRVLDDVRAQNKTVTILCPIVRTFIGHNPTYVDLIDAKHPGVTGGSRRS